MTALDARVSHGFASAGLPQELIDELLEAFIEARRHFYRGDLRPSEIEGARFSGSIFRILQWDTTGGSYTPLGKTLPSIDKMMDSLLNANAVDSVRVHIPLTLRLIYDVRNKRDVAHLGDGIDPNQQDATLVVNNMDWVMAELCPPSPQRVGERGSRNHWRPRVEGSIAHPRVRRVSESPQGAGSFRSRSRFVVLARRAGCAAIPIAILGAPWHAI